MNVATAASERGEPRDGEDGGDHDDGEGAGAEDLGAAVNAARQAAETLAELEAELEGLTQEAFAAAAEARRVQGSQQQSAGFFI